MAKGQLSHIVRHVRGLAATAGADDCDRQLLARYMAARDEAAFAELVRRHGGLVLSVCRAVLRHEQDAEDAFQATFLVLARRAGSVRKTDALASFLYGVACRTALRARRGLARRGSVEGRAAPGRPPEQPVSEAALRELQAVLYEEVALLPEKYRAPFVLCCLEGKGRAEAALQLGWKEGTLSGRLAEARDLLRRRLARRGVEVPAALAGAALAAAVVPSALADAAVGEALRFAAGARVSPRVGGLANAVLHGLVAARMRTVLVLALLLGVVAAGAELLAGRTSEGGPESPAPQPGAEPQAGTDRNGDPLPAGALARLGAVRFRHEGEAQSLAFSPDRKLLAASSGDGCIHLWDTATGREVRRVRTARGFASTPAIAFAPDGRRLASLDGTGVGALWDVGTGQSLVPFGVPTGEGIVGRLPFRFTPDGKTLLAPRARDEQGADVAAIDAASGKELRHFAALPGRVVALAVSSDGRTVAVGTSEPSVQLWDLARGTLLRRLACQEAPSADALAFSPDGTVLASADAGAICLTEVGTGKEVGRLPAAGERAEYVCFTPDGNTLVSDGKGCKVRVWDVPGRKQRRELDGRMWVGRSIALAPDGKTVALGTVYCAIRQWDVASGKELFAEFAGHDGRITAVAFSPDGRLLASGDDNLQTRLWDPATGQSRHTFPIGGGSLAFSPDGRRLASAPGDEPIRFDEPIDETARVWDVAAGKELLRLRHPDAHQVRRVAFTPDGAALLSLEATIDYGETQGTLALDDWDAGTGRRQRRLALGKPYPRGVAFSPDGRLVALGGSDDGKNPVRVVEVRSGRELLVLEGRVPLRPTTFSPDGRLLATQEWDLSGVLSGQTIGGARIWELVTGKEVFRLEGAGGVVFSPDGRLVAAALGTAVEREADGPPRIGVWDAATGKRLQELSGFGSAVSALAFAPDGRRLASGLGNGTVLVWDVSAAARLVRQTHALDPAERERLWAALADEDAGRARAAGAALAADPGQALALLRDRLKLAAAREPGHIRRLIADLDSEQFEVRQAAARGLERLGAEAEAELRQAQAAKPSPEVARRLEALLAAVRVVRSPEVARPLRAVAVLEAVGTPEAQEVLEALAKGAPEARLTQDAKASRERLARSVAATP
jgi:RNA polymerase sigma factor (sigma-70 family)